MLNIESDRQMTFTDKCSVVNRLSYYLSDKLEIVRKLLQVHQRYYNIVM
jgi:hypothetical protein